MSAHTKATAEVAAILASNAAFNEGKRWIIVFNDGSGRTQVGGSYKSKARARARAHRLDTAYGACRHSVLEQVVRTPSIEQNVGAAEMLRELKADMDGSL